jgi:hypothetical protein
MPKNSLRSGIVIVLLLGTLALAVPYVSSTVDAWLFSDATPARPKWNTQRPAADKLQPANPDLIPPGKQLSHEHYGEEEGAPLAFEYREATPLDRQAVRPVEHEEPEAQSDRANTLAQLQEQIQALGAVYLTVERDGDRFECRSLFPLSSQSSYQKAFSAVGSTPQAAMEQVLAEAHNWQRSQRR